MSFVIKQIIPERVEWLSETDLGWWLYTEDINQRYEFDTVEEAWEAIDGKPGIYHIEPTEGLPLPRQAKAKFYKLSQGEYKGYDTFDSCIVVALSEEEARLIHPRYGTGERWRYDRSWVSKEQAHLIAVEEIGIAYDHLQPGTVVMSSFNAG
jgi:hypothetical protein